MSWFYTRQIVDGCWLVGEPGQVNSFLIAGTDRAIAVDTGLGIAPITPVHRSLTPLPVAVVNTHYHADHIGGNHEYADISIHPAGAQLIDQRVPDLLLREYMAFAHRMIAAARAYRAIDVEYFHLLNGESDPRDFPEGFDPRAWTIQPSHASGLLDDGDTIDLGGRVLTVLHTPGHSPDSISLLDERNGILLAGDTVATGPIYGHFPDGNLRDFAASAHRLADLAAEVRLVLVGHFGRPVVESAILTELSDGLERLFAGRAELQPFYDLHLNPVELARFDRCGVTVPLGWRPENC